MHTESAAGQSADCASDTVTAPSFDVATHGGGTLRVNGGRCKYGLKPEVSNLQLPLTLPVQLWMWWQLGNRITQNLKYIRPLKDLIEKRF